jgi:hypothetical protein
MKILKNAITVVIISFSSIIYAQTLEIPSCYEHESIKFPPQNEEERGALELKKSNRAVIVLVDETAVLPQKIQDQAIKLNENFFKKLSSTPDRPGLFYQSIKFSTFSDGKFSSTMVKGVLEGGASLTEKANALAGSKRTKLSTSIKNLNVCLIQQVQLASKKASESIANTMKQGSSEIPKSDILTAIKEVGTVFRSRPEEEKVLLIISDMMEHSTYTSFYEKGGDLKQIDPVLELSELQKQKYSADLKDVKVWILGGGYFAKPGTKEQPRSRDPKKIELLESFWAKVFQQSKAELKEFGKPELLGSMPQ